ncbi:MAG: MarR family winged helix-turn-helix transcriptional regulator [Nitrososphaeraceae archaeon]
MLEQWISTDTCTCGELRKAARAITILYDDAIKSSGLLSTQFGLLQVIYNIDSIRISDLADRLRMDRTTLTRNLSVLEREGLIKISQGKDLRTRIVAATQKGRSSVAKATPLWNEVQRKVRQKMGESSWHELMQNLGGFLNVTDQLTNQNDRNV